MTTKQKLGSKYFLSKELAANLLDCKESKVEDLFLINLKRDFSEKKLLDAWEKQKELHNLYYTDYIMQFAEEEEFEFDEEEFAKYILSSLNMQAYKKGEKNETVIRKTWIANP